MVAPSVGGTRLGSDAGGNGFGGCERVAPDADFVFASASGDVRVHSEKRLGLLNGDFLLRSARELRESVARKHPLAFTALPISFLRALWLPLKSAYLKDYSVTDNDPIDSIIIWEKYF